MRNRFFNTLVCNYNFIRVVVVVLLIDHRWIGVCFSFFHASGEKVKSETAGKYKVCVKAKFLYTQEWDNVVVPYLKGWFIQQLIWYRFVVYDDFLATGSPSTSPGDLELVLLLSIFFELRF